MVLSPIQKRFVYIPKQPWSFILCSQSTWRYWPVNIKPGGRSESCIYMAPSIYKLKKILLFTLPKCSTELLVFPLRARWSKYGTGGNKNDQLARPDRSPSGFPKWLCISKLRGNIVLTLHRAGWWEVKQQFQHRTQLPAAEPESQNATQFVPEEWYKQPQIFLLWYKRALNKQKHHRQKDADWASPLPTLNTTNSKYCFNNISLQHFRRKQDCRK